MSMISLSAGGAGGGGGGALPSPLYGAINSKNAPIHCALSMKASKTITDSSTSPFSDDVQKYIGGVPINGWLHPEQYVGQFAMLTELSTVGGAYLMSVFDNATDDAIIQRRFLLPFELKAGAKLKDFRFYQNKIGTNYNNSFDNDGATFDGFASITCTLKLIASDGTMRTVATGVQTVDWNTSTGLTQLNLTGTGASEITSLEGEQVIMDIEIEQQRVGSNASYSGVGFYTGYSRKLGLEYQEVFADIFIN